MEEEIPKESRKMMKMTGCRVFCATGADVAEDNAEVLNERIAPYIKEGWTPLSDPKSDGKGGFYVTLATFEPQKGGMNHA